MLKHATSLLRRLTHLPRRIVRESLMVIQIVQFFLVNRLGRKRVIAPGGPVVSLTTYRKRSKTVYLAIESIARGEVLPSRLLLWIDDDALINDLPASIRRLQHRGLEVQKCGNYGPHKKYFPYIEANETFESLFVTADDDLLYPQYWLQKLIQANHEHPGSVNSFWAHEIAINAGGFAKYADWKQCRTTDPHFRHMIHSGIGTIYPPSFLKALKQVGSAFEDCCPTADDVWLHVQALRAGYKVRQIVPRLPYFSFHPIPGTQDAGLCRDNVDGTGNDRQIRDTYSAADIQLLLADSSLR